MSSFAIDPFGSITPSNIQKYKLSGLFKERSLLLLPHGDDNKWVDICPHCELKEKKVRCRYHLASFAQVVTIGHIFLYFHEDGAYKLWYYFKEEDYEDLRNTRFNLGYGILSLEELIKVFSLPCKTTEVTRPRSKSL